MPRGPGRPKHKVLGLFDEGVAKKPKEWKQASLPERACMAAAAMAEYLWSKWPRESAQILFILPGEKEIYDVRIALNTWYFGFEWEHYCDSESSVSTPSGVPFSFWPLLACLRMAGPYG